MSRKSDFVYKTGQRDRREWKMQLKEWVGNWKRFCFIYYKLAVD